MDEGRSTSQPMRVVVLSREQALAARVGPCCPPGTECVGVASGYEAAAEILAAPVEAMVIDLRAMSPAHRRLLDIARQMNVEMLGVGALPAGMSSDDLSGVRLLSRADLDEALARLAPAGAGAGGAAGAAAGEFAPSAGDDQPPAEPSARPGKKPLPVPQAPPAPAPPPAAQSPRGLLTPEEISALLEKDT